MGTSALVPPVAILDIDGTLMDTNYHHALAWYRAFRQQGLVVPVWRIHERIGMGGEKLVADLLGEEKANEVGDAVRTAEKILYAELIDEVQPLSGARELIERLKQGGHAVVLASSAKPSEVDRYVEMLDADELADGWTSSGDVEQTKPAPDLLQSALDRVGARSDGAGAVLVGDSIWDCEAARQAGIESVALLTGGFAEDRLRQAGAAAVFESIEDLLEGLDGTPLGRSG